MMTLESLKKKYKTSDRINVSRENKKLKPNAETAFIIWNIPAVVTCPYRTKMCEAECYALKAERVYPDCIPSRYAHLEMSKQEDFVERMTFTILSIAAGTKKQNIIVRIHESGDFYNQAYTNKWLEIINNCSVDPRIRFIAYTKSFKFFDGVALPSNFSLRASIWADTKPEQLALIEKNDWNVYTAVEKFSDNDTFTQCRCEDCATCGKCWGNDKVIACEIH